MRSSPTFTGKEFLFEKPDGRKFCREYISMQLLLDARKVPGRLILISILIGTNVSVKIVNKLLKC